ncbi:MAG: alkaline phosphatase family protein [Oscillospiraceae bacterium]|jgi:predicted AlkP superfamily pyrophosphatase or phosphodiesterase|nr:alkaline phosphatase family protein [Oscillospiraceae bacterium]
MNPNLFLPDYTNSILGIPNSILAHYGAKPHHPTLPALDEKLCKGYKNVVLLVLDGLGDNLLNAHAPDGFLADHRVSALSSVYPSTTASALTTLESGLTPIEHGWLGWSGWFEEAGENVELFTNKIYGTDRSAAEHSLAWMKLPYKNLFTQVREASPDVETCRVSPFGEYWCDTNEALCSHIEILCKKGGRRYIYAYHFQPDTDEHVYGCYGERVKADVALFDRQLERLAASLSDTLLIVTADHGLIDIQMRDIEETPDLFECLAIPPTREPRSLSLFVKEERKTEFPRRWNARFGGDYILMTGDEAVHNPIFGPGTPHPRARGFLGDYTALATGKVSVWFRNAQGVSKGYKALHAGLCRDEMVVPLVLVER